MRKQLIDVIFASEKRKNILLSLKDDPKEIDFLLKSLDETRTALIPQIRILEDYHLVDHKKEVYKLTTIGKLVVEEMVPLLGIVEIFDTDIDYWGTHKIDFIPPHLLERINELGSGRIRNPSLEDLYELDKKIIETTMKSTSMRIISSFVHPDSFKIIEDFIANGIEITAIITEELYEKLRVENYNEFKGLLENKNTKILLYPDKISFISFTQNAYCSFFRLVSKKGSYDNLELFFCNQFALEWGKEFFEYYLKDSIPITEI